MLDEAALGAEVVTRRRSMLRTAGPVATLLIALVVVGVGALAVGRYAVPFGQTYRILLSRVFPLDQTWTDSAQRVVLLVRLPRVLLSVLVGGGLAVSGAVLQATFRNPLVNPQIIGVSSGASFGGALALFWGLGSVLQVGGAFFFGLVALLVIFAVTRGGGGRSVLMIVLAGVVTGSFFSALVSLLTYLADPYSQLPAIVFWLLGSLATATYPKVLLAAVPVLVGVATVLLLRWRINVLSLGDEDAAALGIRPERLRWLLLVAVAAIVAGAVAVSGVIGWVGLVVPHLARMWVGPDHRVLLPVSLLMGGIYLTLIDTLARSMTAGEIPVGVLTALIGAPVFFLLLRRNRNRIWDDA
ncbi:MAG TPA: iron ABC transporter permease [Mycobacteriales bacterium]|nr:iron ABC transporter permease [Mycobacteriales bacterium]